MAGGVVEMSRSGYDDDCTGSEWELIKWRGQVASAIRGKRGQAFLNELLDALEAMPERRLIAHELHAPAPAFIPPEFARPRVCALGAVGLRRGVDLSNIDPSNYNHHERLAKIFGVAHQLIQEIEYENDGAGDYYGNRTPEQRWQAVHDWAMNHISPVPWRD